MLWLAVIWEVAMNQSFENWIENVYDHVQHLTVSPMHSWCMLASPIRHIVIVSNHVGFHLWWQQKAQRWTQWRWRARQLVRWLGESWAASCCWRWACTAIATTSTATPTSTSAPCPTTPIETRTTTRMSQNQPMTPLQVRRVCHFSGLTSYAVTYSKGEQEQGVLKSEVWWRHLVRLEEDCFFLCVCVCLFEMLPEISCLVVFFVVVYCKKNNWKISLKAEIVIATDFVKFCRCAWFVVVFSFSPSHISALFK